MFLVMPLMAGGSLEKRAPLFKGSLDAVIDLGTQLASALGHAHRIGIIHRDVKPANILFADHSNSPVLSDFGICLLTDAPRNTEDAERVGPWAFMAPELENGGQLDVTPAADVYSLGKVLYFALSGGKVILRERHREPQNDVFAGRGARRELFGRLLDRMICDLKQRIKTMEDVAADLKRIAEWDHQVTAAFSPGAQAALERLLAHGREELSVEAHNEKIREADVLLIGRYKTSLSTWLDGQVSALSRSMSHEGISVAKVLPADYVEKMEQVLPQYARHTRDHVYGQPLYTTGIVFRRSSDVFKKDHHLLFRALLIRTVHVSFGPKIAREQSRPIGIVFWPYYYQDKNWQASFSNVQPARPSFGQPLNGRLLRQLDDSVLAHTSSVQEWPADIAAYKGILDRAVEIFVDRMASWAQSSTHGLE